MVLCKFPIIDLETYKCNFTFCHSLWMMLSKQVSGNASFAIWQGSMVNQRLRLCMNTSFSNSVTSCSFFSSAPTSGGTATLSSWV